LPINLTEKEGILFGATKMNTFTIILGAIWLIAVLLLIRLLITSKSEKDRAESAEKE